MKVRVLCTISFMLRFVSYHTYLVGPSIGATDPIVAGENQEYEIREDSDPQEYKGRTIYQVI